MSEAWVKYAEEILPGDVPVEDCALISLWAGVHPESRDQSKDAAKKGDHAPVLARTQLTEVLRGPGDDVVVELEDDAASGAAADGDVEVDYRARLGHAGYGDLLAWDVGGCML